MARPEGGGDSQSFVHVHAKSSSKEKLEFLTQCLCYRQGARLYHFYVFNICLWYDQGQMKIYIHIHNIICHPLF